MLRQREFWIESKIEENPFGTPYDDLTVKFDSFFFSLILCSKISIYQNMKHLVRSM